MRSTELVAMRVGNHLSGSFFLGCGSVDGKEVYTYMYRTYNGDLRRGYDNAYRATIQETNERSPRREYEARYLYHWWLLPWEMRRPDTMPRFVVPPGSVVKEFEIN
jgi:hypothetical protein